MGEGDFERRKEGEAGEAGEEGGERGEEVVHKEEEEDSWGKEEGEWEFVEVRQRWRGLEEEWA